MIIPRNKRPYRSSNIYRVTASINTDFPFLNPFEKVERARKIVFTFDYPTPDSINSEDFKKFFETMFITRFWERWFRQETFESFSIQLYSKMLEIMPVYANMLDAFFRENKDEIFYNKSTTKSNGKNTTKGTTETVSTSEDTRSGNDVNKNINSAFPASMMTAGNKVGSVEYANNGGLSNVESSSEGNSLNDSETTVNNEVTSESESETLSGVLLDSIIKFNKEYSNIFSNMLNEFNCLFSFLIY